MINIELERGDEYRSIPVTGKPISPVAPKRAVARARPESADAYLSPYGNERLNSRLPHPLPGGSWQLRWKTEINPDFPPLFVLQAADRIAIYSGKWQMLDLEGKLLASEQLGGGPLVLDPSHAGFFAFIPDGYLCARRLLDGKEIFAFRPMFGDEYTRMFMARRGSRLLIVGWERTLDPDRTKKAEKSILEIIDLGTPPRADDMGFLVSGTPVGTLYISWPVLLTAAHDDFIVAAAPGFVYIISWNLEVQAAWEADFVAESLSLDEMGRIYLNVRTNKRSELWLLTRQGERLYSFALPGGPYSLRVPPVIGYDHTAYVLASQHIYAVAGDGKLQWSRVAAGAIGGASVTADDQLLVSEGSELAAYNIKGERRTLFVLPGEQLATPPLLAAHGDLLIATKSHLYCLSAKQ